MKYAALVLLLISGPILLSGCVEPFQKKAVVWTDKSEYALGETVKIRAGNKTQPYLLTCGGEDVGFKVFRVGTLRQEELDQSPYVGGKYRLVECENGEVIEHHGMCCIMSCQQMHHDSLNFTWDQTELILVNDTCGNQTYETKKKKQVPPGKYKAVFGYYADSDCEKFERVEKEFLISG
jgi:hypothetical protein